MMLIKFLVLILLSENVCPDVMKRALQKSHEKPQADKWFEAFFGRNLNFDQVPSLVNLVNTVTLLYLSGSKPIILYDTHVEESDGLLLEQLFKSYPIAYVHGQITADYTVKMKGMFNNKENTCLSYVIFMADVMRCKDLIGEQTFAKVVIVARSSQWRVHEFLSSEVSRYFVNLLVIAQSEKIVPIGKELPYILYTHKLYTDGLGSSIPVVLTSWKENNFSISNNLFPPKMRDGFAGHRFIISVAHQPPFVVKRGMDHYEDIVWDGVEVRIVSLLAEMYNFTTDFREAKSVNQLGSGDAIVKELNQKKANLGVGGIYVTPERINDNDVSVSHSQDCASFITLTSTALPRYRAIMGPFHWSVWLALTAVYLFAIFPLALSDKLTLRHLLEKPEEIENMFWYVFGTFTNCFTFTGEASWGKSSKITTRLLVGFYWIFTIITTACYTGSIIAFVTLPIYPETIDSTDQLLSGRFQIGTLDKGGWQYWFSNSSDIKSKKLFRNIEYLPNIESGIKNVTKAFFWPYAYMGSYAELDFVIRTNYTSQSKRSVLHVSKDCFVPYGVSIMYTLNSIYKNVLNKGILLAVESGFNVKFLHDVEWEVMRSPTGKLLQADAVGSMKIQVEDRPLTLDDTQGMFLLLGAGFLLGAASLLSEWLGGCFKFCRNKIRRLSTASIESNPRSHDTPTPREKLNSLPYSVNTDLNQESRNANHVENGSEKGENHVDFIFHADADNKSINLSSSTDINEEIDRIFNLDSVFGENNDEEQETAEEIASFNSNLSRNGHTLESVEESCDSNENLIDINDS